MATIKTRIKLRYDEYTNWTTNNPVLLAGEVAVTSVPSAPTKDVNSVPAPQILFKVGDGTSNYNTLPWASGLAADVYDWAKKQFMPITGESGVVATTDANGATVKADLKDYTKSANASTKAAANANRTYAIELDKDGKLAVVVPWTDNNTNTAHTHTNGVGLVRTGDGGTSGAVDYKVALADETLDTNAAVTRPSANANRTYPVIADKNGKLAAIVPWTDTNTTSFTITANATDDDVVVLTGTNGTNAVTYNATHAQKGPAAGYTSGNTTTSISGSGGSGTIKLPQITVDKYGHVTAAADENVTITLPTVPNVSVTNGAATVPTTNTVDVVASGSASGHAITNTRVTVPTKKYVDDELAKIDQFKYVVSTSAATTPEDVVWYNGSTQVTGTLVASATTEFTIYLVPCKHSATATQKGYDEYLTVKNGTAYSWEVLGNTQDIDLSGYVPITRKVNNKALSADISLGASDVGVTETAFPGLNKTGTVTSVAAGDGLSGGTITATGTIAHATPTGAAVKATGFYKVATDKFGHVTGTTAVAKSDITGLGIPGADTNTWRQVNVNGTQLKSTDITSGAVNFKNGSNVTITGSGNDITIAAASANNAALKDASGATIFTANASADVQITVIDCGTSADTW